MITAVDTSILVDVLCMDPVHGRASAAALSAASDAGQLLVCPVVWAEVRALFASAEACSGALASANIRFDPFDGACADRAGELWRRYRASGGRREHLVPDFLVGAHALVRCGRLLSRDRGFLRRYFTGLKVTC